MTKATNKDLGELHGAIARALTDVVENGAVVGLAEDGEPIKAPASAAYFMAGITFLKNNNITADAEKNADLNNLAAALAAKRRARKEGMGTMQDMVRDAGEQLDRDLGMMQ